MRNKWIHCAVCRRPAATGGGGGGGIVDTEAIAYALWNPCGAEGAEECHKCNASAVKCHRLRCIGFTRNQYVIVWHWIRCSVAICHGHHSVLWKSHWQILPFCWLWRYSPQCAHSAPPNIYLPLRAKRQTQDKYYNFRMCGRFTSTAIFTYRLPYSTYLSLVVACNRAQCHSYRTIIF